MWYNIYPYERVYIWRYIYIYIYTHIQWNVYIYSAVKENEIMSFAVTWTDLEIIVLTELRQRRINVIWYHLYVESKKNDRN